MRTFAQVIRKIVQAFKRWLKRILSGKRQDKLDELPEDIYTLW